MPPCRPRQIVRRILRDPGKIPALFQVHLDGFSECDSHSFNRLRPLSAMHLHALAEGRWNAGPKWHKFHRIFAIYLWSFSTYSGRAFMETGTRLFRLFALKKIDFGTDGLAQTRQFAGKDSLVFILRQTSHSRRMADATGNDALRLRSPAARLPRHPVCLMCASGLYLAPRREDSPGTHRACCFLLQPGCG